MHAEDDSSSRTFEPFSITDDKAEFDQLTGKYEGHIQWLRKIIFFLSGLTMFLVLVLVYICFRRRPSLTIADGIGDKNDDTVRLFDLMDVDESGEISFADFSFFLTSPDMDWQRGIVSAGMSVQEETKGEVVDRITVPDPSNPVSVHTTEDDKCKQISVQECAATPECFPHHEGEPGFTMIQKQIQIIRTKTAACWGTQTIDCYQDDAEGNGYPEIAKKLLLTSDGMTNNDLRNAFRHLVMQLPPDVVGEQRLADAKARDLQILAANGFLEPELYENLQVVVLYDACGFKERNVKLLGEWICEDASDVLKVLGFKKFKYLSVFDLRDAYADNLAQIGNDARKELYDEIRGKLFRLQDETQKHKPVFDPDTRGKIVRYIEEYHLQEHIDTISTADIIAGNGGNVDWFTFLVANASKQLADAIRKKTQSGRVVYFGQSAGAIGALADIGVSVQAAPNVADNLLQCIENRNMKNLFGLGLMSRCAVRPHYTRTWDMAAEVYERGKALRVVRIPNGEGMMCADGDCKMVGMAHTCKYNETTISAQCETHKGIAPHQESTSIHSSEGVAIPRHLRLVCKAGELESRAL